MVTKDYYVRRLEFDSNSIPLEDFWRHTELFSYMSNTVTAPIRPADKMTQVKYQTFRRTLKEFLTTLLINWHPSYLSFCKFPGVITTLHILASISISPCQKWQPFVENREFDYALSWEWAASQTRISKKKILGHHLIGNGRRVIFIRRSF